MPPPNSPTSAAAEATAVTQKFRDLEIRGHRSNYAVGFRATDPTAITQRFRNLDISSHSPRQMGTTSAQSTAAGSSYARRRPKPVQITLEIPTHSPGEPLNLQSEPLGGHGDYISEGYVEVNHLDDDDKWSESLAMRLAMHKKGEKRTRTASKRMSRGPIRNKVGGVSRHRHNGSRSAAVWNRSSAA